MATPNLGPHSHSFAHKFDNLRQTKFVKQNKQARARDGRKQTPHQTKPLPIREAHRKGVGRGRQTRRSKRNGGKEKFQTQPQTRTDQRTHRVKDAHCVFRFLIFCLELFGEHCVCQYSPKSFQTESASLLEGSSRRKVAAQYSCTVLVPARRGRRAESFHI